MFLPTSCVEEAVGSGKWDSHPSRKEEQKGNCWSFHPSVSKTNFDNKLTTREGQRVLFGPLVSSTELGEKTGPRLHDWLTETRFLKRLQTQRYRFRWSFSLSFAFSENRPRGLDNSHVIASLYYVSFPRETLNAIHFICRCHITRLGECAVRFGAKPPLPHKIIPLSPKCVRILVNPT